MSAPAHVEAQNPRWTTAWRINFRGTRQALEMDIFGPQGAKIYPYPPPAGVPGRQLPGGGYG
eukprot:7403672-Pyramimonas_sp.AAC.1